MGTQKIRLNIRDGSFEHPKHKFKLMSKKILVTDPLPNNSNSLHGFSSADFFSINLKKQNQEYRQRVKQCETQYFVWPHLGPNSLQRLLLANLTY